MEGLTSEIQNNHLTKIGREGARLALSIFIYYFGVVGRDRK